MRFASLPAVADLSHVACATSYFVGGRAKGLARKLWLTREARVAGVIVNESYILATGNVYLTDRDGEDVRVDKTERDAGGEG